MSGSNEQLVKGAFIPLIFYHLPKKTLLDMHTFSFPTSGYRRKRQKRQEKVNGEHGHAGSSRSAFSGHPFHEPGIELGALSSIIPYLAFLSPFRTLLRLLPLQKC